MIQAKAKWALFDTKRMLVFVVVSAGCKFQCIKLATLTRTRPMLINSVS